MIKLTQVAVTAALALGTAGAADARAFGTLTFDQLTGTVTDVASIPVFLTVTNTSTEAVTTGPDAQLTSGLSDADITAAGYDPAAYTDRLFNELISCSDSFTGDCGTSNGPYHFDFNFDPPAFVTPSNFDLGPGASYSFLIGTFVPNNGRAAAGVYAFNGAAVNFQIRDPSVANSTALLTFASTCPDQSPTCTFTRTVTPTVGAVPEPASWALLVAGFGTVGVLARRRRTTVTV